MAWYDDYIERAQGVCGGEPITKDTRISVLAVVEYKELYGALSRMVAVFGGDISLEEIRAALAYYEDHKEEIERYRRRHDEADVDGGLAPDVFRPLPLQAWAQTMA